MNESTLFGSRLRRLRQEAGLSLREFAALAGVGFPYVSKIEKPPNAQTLVRFARALGTDPDALLVAASKPPPDLVQRLASDLEFVRRVRSLT